MNDILSASRHVTGLTDEERAERARLAVKNFRAMQHSLTGFARALTGNQKVRVEMDTGAPRTDGERIFFRPPLALGAPVKHDRSLCEKRDINTRLLCEACRTREEVMAPIYHEISHIAFDSFAPTLEHHKVALTQRAIEEWGTKYAEQIEARVHTIPAHMMNDYKSMASLISPFLPMILNALEDARVNASMFRARPGVKVMMKSHVYGLLEDGVEQEDGSVTKWYDLPLNAQVIAACFVIGAGYDIMDGWFHEEVNTALLDDKLDDLCVQAGMARRAAEVYELSFKVLARLRELGFCKNEIDPDDEEEEQTDDEPDDGGSGDPDDSPAPAPDPDVEPDGQGDDEAGNAGDVADEGAGDPEEGDKGADVPAEAEAGHEGSEAPAEESEAGAGSDGDEEVDPSDEAAEAGGAAGPPMGDEAGDEAGTGGPEQGGEAEPEGEAGSDESALEGSGASEESDGDDVRSGDDAGDGGDQDSEDHTGGDESSGVEAAGRDDGSDEAASEGEAVEDDRELPDGDGRPVPGDDQEDGAGQGDRAESEPEPEAEAFHGDGVGDDAEPEDQADEGGVPSSDPVPSRPESSGDGGEGTEDAERDANSEAGGEGGDEDGADDGSVGGTASSESGGFDWSAPEEGRIDPEQDAGGESAEQHAAPEPEATEGETDELESDVDPDPFDMRGDEGKGGVKLEEESLDYGDADEVERALKLIENHMEPPKSLQNDIDRANDALDQAIIQGVYFETPSAEVYGVRIHREGDPGLNDEGAPVDNAWNHTRVHEAEIDDVEAGIECDLDVPESIMGKALLHTRRTFDANKASAYEPNLKSGRVNSRVLGKRAWSGDERLFGKKRVPGKRDYFVLIGIDVSGSTVGVNLALAKRAAMAQAELCQRAGVKFAVYAHTFNDRNGLPYERTGMVLDIYEVKTADDPWDEASKNRLATLGPDGGNLDGHTLEFYRKRLDEVQATDKIILYYTDGRMPASNYDEELEILQREIRTCRAKGYTLLGVGIRTDSPIKHGLDTVRVDNDENLKDVVSHLEKRLAGPR